MQEEEVGNPCRGSSHMRIDPGMDSTGRDTLPIAGSCPATRILFAFGIMNANSAHKRCENWEIGLLEEPVADTVYRFIRLQAQARPIYTTLIKACE